jgi:hypothetical protein
MTNSAQAALRRPLLLSGIASGAVALALVSGALLGSSRTLLASPSPAAAPQVRFPRPPDGRVDPRAPKTLTGQVVDKEGKGLPQAVVYLKNQRTLEVRTHISDGEGKYRFNGLNPETDFAVHAEHRGASSPTRTVSSFDDKKDVYLVLEIDPARQ